jgi:hypothetical protein
MRLWGKVVKGFLIVFAVVFGAVAIFAPAARAAALGAAAISLVVAFLGVPLIVRLFSSFTGDEEVLEKGLPGSATITALRVTRLRYNRYYPVVAFRLAVECDGERFPAEARQVVDPELLPRLAPGTVVAVRVAPGDRRRVVIDWRQPPQPAG